MAPVDSLSLCESGHPLSVASRDEHYQVVESMSRQARHSFYIFNDVPDPFDTTDFIDAVRRIVAVESDAMIRILLHSADKLVHPGQRLVAISRRPGSSVQIYRLNRAYRHAFLLTSQCGVPDRCVTEHYEGMANFKNLARAADAANME